jgi:MFS family permease
MSIVSIGFILIGLADNVNYFFFTSPVMGFGGGILMTNISAWMLSIVAPKKRVKASGYLTSSLFLGQFFSPILFHLPVDFFGVQKFFIVVGLGLASLLLFIVLYNKRSASL